MKNVVWGIISGALVFLALGIPTALVPSGLFKRMIEATIWDYIFLFAVPVLFGVFIALYKGKSKKKTCGVAGGLAAGWLGVICPICTSFLVYVFGATTLLTYFDPIRPLFGLLSVVILSLLIYFQYAERK